MMTTRTEEAAPMEETRLLTPDEAAEQLRVPRSWMYAAAKDGRFPCVRTGRYVRFRQADVDRWIANGGRLEDQ